MKLYTILATAAAFLLLLSGCQKEKIGTSGLIKDQFYLENDDAKMHIYVEGNISSDKILLVVHGGPGDGALYYNIPEATNIAEKDFAVAYWDQRLAGATQANNSSTNIPAYIEDMEKVILLLRHRYGQSKKIYLMGHSWGGLLVPLFLQKGTNQSLVSGWIQVDGAHNYAMVDSLSRVNLLNYGQQQLAAGRHREDWERVVDYCRDHNPKGNYSVARKINNYAHDSEDWIDEIATGRTTSRLIKFFIREYRYPITTFLSNVVYNSLIKKLDEQAYSQALQLSLINSPVLLLWGKYDFVCPPQLADDLVSRISSRDITRKLFDNSGHSPMFNEPVAFWQTVAGWVNSH